MTRTVTSRLSRLRSQRGMAMTEAVLVTTLVAVAALLVLGFFGGAMKCQHAGVMTELAGGTGTPRECINRIGEDLVADAAATLPTTGSGDSSFFGQAALGLASGLKNQATGFFEILRDPVGFAGDLYTLGKALVTDPRAVFDALVEELGADAETLLSGDPFRTAELIGENLSPLQLARVAKRLADFAGSGKIGKRGTRCASFVTGTPIWTGEGPRSIESLSADDKVRARSDDTYDDSLRPVVQTMNRDTKRHLVVTIGGERIGVTAEHPFWVQGHGWTPAVELRVGSPLATATGEVLVSSVETVESPGQVFNLTVAWDHSYFAGASGIWVHNANEDCNLGPEHHICTNKNCKSTARGGPWTPKFEAIFEKAGMNLQDSFNKVRVPGHKGPHPELYHQTVFDRLVEATRGKSGQAYKRALQKELTEIAEEAATPGTDINDLLTKKIR